MNSAHVAALSEPQESLVSDAGAFWAQSHCNPLVRDLSHWAGEGRWTNTEQWRGIGRANIELFEQLCALAEQPRPVTNMLEWGPGGGANAVRFACEVERFYGVDISAANLGECERAVRSAGLENFHPILIDAAHPARVLEHIDEPVDFLLSTAVFQHFPSKQYGITVTRVAHQLLTTPGVALIQTRYDDGSERYGPKDRNYAQEVATFTSYGVDEYWQIATDAGFEPLAVVLRPHVRYAYYFLKKA